MKFTHLHLSSPSRVFFNPPPLPPSNGDSCARARRGCVLEKVRGAVVVVVLVVAVDAAMSASPSPCCSPIVARRPWRASLAGEGGVTPRDADSKSLRLLKEEQRRGASVERRYPADPDPDPDSESEIAPVPHMCKHMRDVTTFTGRAKWRGKVKAALRRSVALDLDPHAPVRTSSPQSQATATVGPPLASPGAEAALLRERLRRLENDRALLLTRLEAGNREADGLRRARTRAEVKASDAHADAVRLARQLRQLEHQSADFGGGRVVGLRCAAALADKATALADENAALKATICALWAHVAPRKAR